MKPKAILFDLDGTLFDRDAAVRELIRQQYTRFPAELAHVPCELYFDCLMDLDAHGYVERTAVYGQAAREFGLSEDLVKRLIAHFWETYAGFCQCFPETLRTLERLRAHGIKLGIITNGSIRTQEMKIRQLGLAPLLDEIVISEREGLHKPDPLIFERALQRLGVPPAEAWFVGDHPDTDIRGAFEAGLKAIWRTTPHWPRPVTPFQEIGALDELEAMLL